MNFDLKSKIEDESVKGLHSNVLLLLLGLAALFIFPSIFLVLLMIGLPTADISLLEYLAYFLGYGSYIAILCVLLKKDKLLKIFKGFNFNNLKVAIIFALILYISSILTSTLSTLIFGQLSSNANQDTLNEGMIKYPIAVSLFSVIFAPVVEELVFRFSIFRPLAKKNKYLAYIITVLSFAGIHFFSSLSVLMVNIGEYGSTQAYSIFFDDLKTLPIYIVGALVLTISYDINKNIATNIMIHSFYNLSQVILMLISIFLFRNIG